MPNSKDEKALAKPAQGWGGLGDFTDAKAFEKAVAANADKVTGGTATAEDVRDAMGNVVPKLEKVKVKHGGACLFQFEDESKQDELVGSIVAYTHANQYWDKPFDEREDGDRPPCSSADGSTIHERSADPQAKSCGSCPRNRDATEKAAREFAFERDRKEACNNYLQLAVALPGREVPVQVQLSNTSFKTWAAYVQKIGTQGRFRTYEVATRIKLRNQKGAGGSEFSVALFELIGPLPKDLADNFGEQTDNYRALLRRTSGEEPAGDDNADAAQAANAAKAVQDAAKTAGAAL